MIVLQQSLDGTCRSVSDANVGASAEDVGNREVKISTRSKIVTSNNKFLQIVDAMFGR